MSLDSVVLNGVDYIRKDSVNNFVENLEGIVLSCVRTYSAGVFIGYIVETSDTKSGRVCKLVNARRLWRWEGASSLSQLAMEGVSNPKNCKFPMEVLEVILVGVIEIIPVTEIAKKSIDLVEVWES